MSIPIPIATVVVTIATVVVTMCVVPGTTGGHNENR